MIVRSLDINKDPFQLQEKDVETLSDETSYISAIEALCTLLTTHDQMFICLNLLARFSSWLTRRHWRGVKHVVRYFQGTIDM